ncbi:hypothetical protein B5E91_12610 [Thomasclavelia spiroformis]|uniref:Uncharacterized protein n=1 Tax=Thomasclavelia spiroformis TaxID=29348 RepID=A0A1Y4QE14_9FIRM|nr:hypothetical protein [Thomasclavelia spiroformis]OUP99924.1 hypothetical protein B5E98_10790 [Thomasclavelia spiroformis]OUQ03486.1 hypothetical protein B5E91_12610 [Thomasclavelia spiroformis]
MKFFKENWKMLTITITVVILFPIIILTPSRYGTIPYDNGIAIVSYGGSILGGFLTLYGVWWTIKDQEKKRYEDLALQYKPILRVIPPINDDEKIIIINSNDAVLLFNMILYIENIGRGEAEDIEITYSECNDLKFIQRNTRISICNHFKDISISGTELECLPVNNNNQLMIQLLVNKCYKEHDIFCFNLNIRFKNTFSKKNTLHHSAKIVIRNNKSLNLENYDGIYSALTTNKYYTN